MLFEGRCTLGGVIAIGAVFMSSSMLCLDMPPKVSGSSCLISAFGVVTLQKRFCVGNELSFLCC